MQLGLSVTDSKITTIGSVCLFLPALTTGRGPWSELASVAIPTA